MNNTTPSPEATALRERLERDYQLDAPARALLDVALQALDRIREAEAILDRDGIVVGEGASARRHPANDVAKQYTSQFLRAWRDLGWDKSDSPLSGVK